jgi:hypothetical protein
MRDAFSMTRPDPFRIRLEDLVSDIRALPLGAAASENPDRWAIDATGVVAGLALTKDAVRVLERQLRLRCAELACDGTCPVDDTEFQLLREELIASRSATFARGRRWEAHLDVNIAELREWLECLRDVPR